MKQIFLLRSRSNRLYVVIGILCLIVMIGVALYIYNERLARSQHQHTEDTTSLIVRAIQPGDHVIGDRNAPVKLMVYSDLSCPYCKSFFENTVPALQKRYGSDIAIIYRHMPLTDLHPRAFAEAVAAECAASLGGNVVFWNYEHRIYGEPGYERGLSDDTLKRIAVDLGLNPARFGACLDDETIVARVKQDATEAAVAGLDYTPTTVLKTATRATIVLGSYYPRYVAALDYLSDVMRATH